MRLVPNSTIISIMARSGEKLFYADNGTQFKGYYEDLKYKPEEFPIIIAVFKNMQDYLTWTKGGDVDATITMLYHFANSGSLEIFGEANKMTYQGAIEFALAA